MPREGGGAAAASPARTHAGRQTDQTRTTTPNERCRYKGLSCVPHTRHIPWTPRRFTAPRSARRRTAGPGMCRCLSTRNAGPATMVTQWGRRTSALPSSSYGGGWLESMPSALPAPSQASAWWPMHCRELEVETVLCPRRQFVRRSTLMGPYSRPWQSSTG
jgi:hypothetical protein